MSSFLVGFRPHTRMALKHLLVLWILACLVPGFVAEPDATAMPVEVVGRDSNGNLNLKTGDLVTPFGLSAHMTGSGPQPDAPVQIGPLFAAVMYPAFRMVPVQPEPPPPPLPGLVPSSLALVPEYPGSPYGLTFGGLAVPRPTLVFQTPPSSSSTTVTGNFTLDGTVGGPGGTAVPLPGTVLFFATGIGSWLAARLRRAGSGPGC